MVSSQLHIFFSDGYPIFPKSVLDIIFTFFYILNFHMYSGLYSGIPDLCHYSLSACVAPLSMGFSRQEYWRGLPFPFPGDLPDPGSEPTSPAWQVDSLPLKHLRSPVFCIQPSSVQSLSRVRLFETP